MVLWNHDERPTREWVLENAPGAHGLLVLLSDKVRTFRRVLLKGRELQDR